MHEKQYIITIRSPDFGHHHTVTHNRANAVFDAKAGLMGLRRSEDKRSRRSRYRLTSV